MSNLPSLTEVVAYTSLNRLVWSLALSWLIVACVKGRGGLINEFLSWGGWVPLGKLSYSMYLVHWTIIQWYMSYTRDLFTYTTTAYVYQVLGHTALSLGISVIFVLCFEMPILHAEKILFASFGLNAWPKPILYVKDEKSKTVENGRKEKI